MHICTPKQILRRCWGRYRKSSYAPSWTVDSRYWGSEEAAGIQRGILSRCGASYKLFTFYWLRQKSWWGIPPWKRWWACKQSKPLIFQFSPQQSQTATLRTFWSSTKICSCRPLTTLEMEVIHPPLQSDPKGQDVKCQTKILVRLTSNNDRIKTPWKATPL